MSKHQTGDLCKVANNLVFNFVQGLELHSTITIENLVDRIVSYNIKSNKPGIYLVKPMEGKIFNKSSITIAFKRKELTLQNFNIVQNNPGQAKEKFLIELSCQIQDTIGITQKRQQLAYLGVVFTRLQKEQKQEKISWNEEGRVRKDKQAIIKNNLDQLFAQKVAIVLLKNEQLKQLISERQTLQAKSLKGVRSSTFTKIDLINVLAVFLLLGFVII